MQTLSTVGPWTTITKNHFDISDGLPNLDSEVISSGEALCGWSDTPVPLSGDPSEP